MALIVQKYGGTSVANIEKIENVAKKIIKTKEAGNEVIVVVSAMAGETDRLIHLAHHAADPP
ncbi:MAG TPA: aspartate kinase, partial [Smithella sp.]|nr:aspartate kinase [Smithella sp.]